MFEKNLSLNELYDLYGQLLSEKKREFFELYYREDLSLSEIALQAGLTRQGVRDLLARAAAELESFEAAMGLLEKKKRLGEISGLLAGRGDPDLSQIAAELSGLL